MANMSKWLEATVLGYIKGSTMHAPSNVYLGLIDDTATDADMEGDNPLSKEITGYTGNRPAITFGAVSKAGLNPSEMEGPVLGPRDFEDMPDPLGRRVKYLVICNAAIGGNVLYWGEVMPVPKAWNIGDTFRAPINGIKLDLD